MTKDQVLELKARMLEIEEALKEDGPPLHCVTLLVGFLRLLPPVFAHLATLQQQRDECHELLLRITESIRPIGGGIQQQAAVVLTRQGVEATFPDTSHRTSRPPAGNRTAG